MKKFALALLLVAAPLGANVADYYVSAPGGDGPEPAGTACTFAAPCTLQTLMRACGTAPHALVAGDTVHLRGGEYDATAAGNSSAFAMTGKCTGAPGQPITIQRYLDEFARIDCGDQSVTDPPGGTYCITDGGDTKIDPPETNLWRQYIWFKGLYVYNSSSEIRITAHGFANVTNTDVVLTSNVMPNFPYIEYQVTVSGNVVTWVGSVNVQNQKFCKANADCSSEGGAWSTTDADRKTVRIAGADYTITALTSNTSITVSPTPPVLVGNQQMFGPWTWNGPATGTGSTDDSGRPRGTFSIDPYGTREDIKISLCTSATVCRLKSIPTHNGRFETHAPSSVATDAQGPYDFGDMVCQNKGCRIVNSYFQDSAPYIFAAQVINSCLQSHQEPNPNPPPATITVCDDNPIGGINDERWTQVGDIRVEGNRVYYHGWVGLERSAAHDGYYQQLYGNAGTSDSSRSYSRNNLLMWPFQHCTQHYGGDEIGTFTISDNICWGGGHGPYNFQTSSDWPTEATGYGGTIGWILGGSGGVSAGCPTDYGVPGGGSKVTLTNEIFTRNFVNVPGTAPYDYGFQKGSCNPTATRNYLIAKDAPRYTRTAGTAPPSLNHDCYENVGPGAICGTWGTVTIGDTASNGVTTTGNKNVFMAPLSSLPQNGSPIIGGPTGLPGSVEPESFNRDNYPGNIYLNSIPTTDRTGTDCGDGAELEDGDCKFYSPDRYEAGRGLAAIHNPDSDATVRVDLCKMGAFTTGGGEKWELYNANCAIPWSVCTPVIKWNTTSPTVPGPVTSCPFYITASATTGAAGVLQPGYRDHDGVALFPKGVDRGPKYVAFSLERDFTVGSSGTPTPVPPTSTPTRTNTPTPSITPTATLTPSLTPSRTPTRTFTPTVGGPTNTQTFTPSRTPTPTPTLTASSTPTITPTPAGGTVLTDRVDVVNCALSSPMTLGSDAIAAPKDYVTTGTANVGLAVCPFRISMDGFWYPFAKVDGPTTSNDSFFWNICDQNGLNCYNPSQPDCISAVGTNCNVIFDVREDRDPNGDPQCALVLGEDGAHWQNMNHRKGGYSCASAGTGGTQGVGSRAGLQLAAGEYKLYIKGRDTGSKLYAVQFSTDEFFEPGDTPPPPTPLPPGTGQGHRHPCASGDHHWIVGHKHPPDPPIKGHTHDFCGPMIP